MPLNLVRSSSNSGVWAAFAGRFLDRLGDRTGPTGFPVHAWLTHRTQRDLLLEEAAGRGLAGWLSPPFSFFSELPRRFGLERRPIGLLAGRLLVSRIAARGAGSLAVGSAIPAETPGRGHMLDRGFSELLPEGVTPEVLRAALATLPADAFTRRRDAWLSDVYERYGELLEARGQFDPRAVHALLAERIAAGGLEAAVGGASVLHVYGITSLRGRRRLFEALAAQTAVEVVAYLPDGASTDEWSALASGSETVRGRDARIRVEVQPVPDAVREARWIARTVKRRIVDEGVEPRRIAIIARSGRDDTRRIHDALTRAGVPSTARLRSRLDEIPALRALLHLLRAPAEEWSWHSLRAVLGSPYFAVGVDLRTIDSLAARARPRGLEGWITGLERLRTELSSERAWMLERAGIRSVRLDRDIEALTTFRTRVAPLEDPRPEREWIEATRELLRGRPLDLRGAACRPAGDRWDVVRLDQRGMLALEGLLCEWLELADLGRERPLPIAAWAERLGRLLEANEIAVTSPMKRGVQVLEAHEAALTPFEHAFVMHANDGVFPPRAAGGLFTDAERERLAESGLPIATRALALERERRLWAGCVGSDRVTITYWTADASGIPRLASLLVPEHDRTGELPRTRVPSPDEARETPPLTVAEMREREVARLRREREGGRSGAFVTPAPERVRQAVLAAFAETLRRGGLDDHARSLGRAVPDDPGEAAALLFGNDRPLSERPTPWNGELRDPVVLGRLGRRFPDGREWSASQLEAYARRPFDFLLERVLGLERVRIAEDEASALTLGRIVHEILEDFYGGLIGSCPESFTEEARDAFERSFARVCEAYESDALSWVGLPHVWSATREELRERLARFLAWELDRRDPGIPILVEWSFGRSSDRPAADLGGPGLDGVERRLLLGGRIDRVDLLRGSGERKLRIVDYKSGGKRGAPGPSWFADGAALQASLYMAAVEALGLGRAETAVYRTIRDPGDRGRRVPADVETSLRFARQITARARAGLFEAVQAGSVEIRDWQPGRDVTRTVARVSSGSRFDVCAPLPVPGTQEALADGTPAEGRPT